MNCKKNSHIGHCTQTAGSADVKVQNILHGRNNITQRYSSTLSLTSALHGVGGKHDAPAVLPPGLTRYSFVYEAGWAPGPICIDAENPAPHRDSNPEPFRP